MSVPITVKFDDRRLQRDIELLIKNSSKTLEDVVNFKLYDGGREASKATGKADKKDIKTTLTELSNNHPKRTVAEMIVIKQKRLDGVTDFDLKEEVRILMSKRNRSIGLGKAGWLPGIAKQAAKVNRFFRSQAKIKDKFGGSKPAVISSHKVEGEIYNDVTGNPPSAKIEELKNIASEIGKQKLMLDIEGYLSKKLNIPLEKFNSY